VLGGDISEDLDIILIVEGEGQGERHLADLVGPVSHLLGRRTGNDSARIMASAG
jgi:hypothetical protein